MKFLAEPVVAHLRKKFSNHMFLFCIDKGCVVDADYRILQRYTSGFCQIGHLMFGPDCLAVTARHPLDGRGLTTKRFYKELNYEIPTFVEDLMQAMMEVWDYCGIGDGMQADI
jgi:hypothetical protein